MKVLISGASGLVGSALIPVLEQQGHAIVRLVRRTPKDGSEIEWSPGAPLDPAVLSGIDAVVNLAGRSIMGRWSPELKREMFDSRVLGTKTIAAALAAAQTSVTHPPRVLVNASAIGFYGNRGDEELTERSTQGMGFLADLAHEWESATRSASDAGVRTVMVRIGVVLAKEGGALKAMLPAFRLGVGGKVSSGKQWMSWITLQDLVRIIARALAEPAWSGAFNAVAPAPVTNGEFSRTLAAVLHRPALFTVPAFAPKLILGAEMVENTLLVSERVAPQRLLQAGFQFTDTDLRSALERLLV